ncbi:element excision factor XisI family protein [Dolichospermum compactum]|uniref:XisI protein n=1 Tax=Dolichospermum compactum NIES-806 TaxID=1973481 RepID=A0A1Z4UZ58_9CYAN|nr:element excision factor XisI family protein [Dolichospermum compactum]BAZ84536.1 XisI protein [Dolichospermum compactum NIES-806]
MEKLAKYRQIVRELLISHATTNEPNIECQLIFDTEHDHYQILDLGWQGRQSFHFWVVNVASFIWCPPCT